MKICIIDPTSTEFNRGSFCYSPYLLCNGLKYRKKEEDEVILIESFQPENFKDLPLADVYIISLWSYPQIEQALFLYLNIPYEYNTTNIFFIGYKAFADSLGLPYVDKFLSFDPLVDNGFLQDAMKTYPRFYEDYRRLLLSDCDRHLDSLEDGNLMYPLFTSYGCPNGCSFCPSTKNCLQRRIVLPLEDVYRMIDELVEKNIRYIHFTDEDFFFNIDRAAAIMDYMTGKNFHCIALGSSRKVWRCVESYGNSIFEESGFELIEIGFESNSEESIISMGTHGKSIEYCNLLASRQKELSFKILWLVLTYYPGETITSLNQTGNFMKAYGFSMEQMTKRLRTNGTVGGLGQYYQQYPELQAPSDSGINLVERPVRLSPSYIPYSFLFSEIRKIQEVPEIEPWIDLYGVRAIHTEIRPLLREGAVLNMYFQSEPKPIKKIQLAILFALYARFSMIQ